jgi:hypothetical protein
LRGSYYLCIPNASIMYRYDTISNRFQKYSDIHGIASGDDGFLYVIKNDGIYKFEQDTENKSFAITTPEIFIPDDMQYRNLIVDINTSNTPVTVWYLINGVQKSVFQITTEDRKRVFQQVTQEVGARVSIRIYKVATSDVDEIALYGVWLQ